MGQLLLTGTGVDKDYEQAAYWFGKAAEKGNSIAQGKLGYLYMAGLGVSKDLPKAYAWLKLAATNKNQQAAKELAELEPTLSPDDKTRGDLLFKELSAKLPTTEPDEEDDE